MTPASLLPNREGGPPMLRDARADDASSLRDLLTDAFREYEGRLDPPSGVHAETAASLGAKIADGGALICDVGGEPVGCAFFRAQEGCLYVGRFGVRPEHRSKGIGSLLLAAAERRARELGFGRLRLNVRLALTGLQDYYAGHGYQPVAYRAHEGYAAATYVQMEKVLELTEAG